MKTRLLHFIFFLWFFLLAYVANAQFHNQKFVTYTTENGLTDNYVVKITTDKKGFVWLATRNGLSRFDGLHFTNYTVNQPLGNGLRSSWITDLAVDEKGLLWVSTEWGVCYYEETTDKFLYVNEADGIVVLYKGPLYIEKDALWIAAENGLKKINTATKKYSSTSLSAIPDPQCISSDGQGNLWIGTRGNGFYVYEVAANKWQHVYFASLPKDAHLMDFYQERDRLFCATSEGLLIINDTKNAALYRQLAGGRKQVIDALTFVTPFRRITGDSLLICGTYNQRLAIFNKGLKTFSEVFVGSKAQLHGIPVSPLHDAAAKDDMLWIGSDMGLTMLNLQLQDYATFLLRGDRGNFEKSVVKKVMPHADRMKRWLLINNPAGLGVFDVNANKIEHVWNAPSADRKYRSLLPSGNQFLLVHEKGIDVFSPPDGIRILYQAQGKILFGGALDAHANLWAGTDDGLMQYDLRRKRATFFACHFRGTAVENNSFSYPFFARKVLPDNAGRIWIASPKFGLFSFHTNTKLFTPYRQPSTKSYETKNRCSDLQFDKEGRLWIGNTAGLSVFDTTQKRFTNFSHTDGLQSSYVYSIAIDERNNLTGRGNAGVFQLDIAQKKFINYAVPTPMSSSLLEQEVSINNGETIVGFEGGFSVYKPATTTNRSPLPVFITGVILNKEKLNTQQGDGKNPLALDYHENTVRLDYTCVNYTIPKGITYRYRLSGGSNEWINVGTQRSVLFTELAPGKYQFSVVAVSPDGHISSQPATFQFTIHPPFWERTWFLALLAISMAVLLWLFYRKRVRYMHRQQQHKLERQQLEIETYRQRLELERISSFFSGSLLNKRTTQEVLDSVAKDLIGRLGFENCMMYLWDEERQLLVQQGGYGAKGAIDGVSDPNKYHLQKNRGIVGAAVSSGRAIMVNDTSQDPRYVSADTIISQSELCVPLVSDSRVLGAINIEQSQKDFFNHHHLQIVSTIAAIVGSRIEAIQLTAARHQKELELEAAARRITETELSMLRSQMNPHFIFNSLNSIQKYIWESKQEDAAEYLTKFARLMRSILENSGQKLVPLQKELSLLRLYVELEHRRSNQQFDYTITADQTIDTLHTMVPPLLLQPFIENAIWHGLNPKASQGELSIEITIQNGKLICIIDDNGIGRKASQRVKEEQHQSMGITISNQRVALLKKQTASEAEVLVMDKEKADGSAAGTKVTIVLPLMKEYAELYDC